MNRTTAIVSSAVSAAAVITGTGLAQASTGPARTATEHLRIMSTAASSDTYTIIATGAFTGGGTYTDGGTSTVKMPGGTFKIQQRDTGKGHETFNEKTCLLRFSTPGKYKLTGGTGIFAGLSGSGTFMATVTVVLARTASGKCSGTKPAVASELLITEHGPASFAS